ncbi:MAG: YebC/PmpR family DNA-binding transcriptional regulator [Candidatus Zambryskibacteria bacterium]|nr:YebC/PmpR family DNA-binding transcriptional regulator [Candidatus Zambryskibacteria bacterium]
MSGHNKWSKIKNKKAITDAQKSKVFGKLIKLIAIESKKVKGDVNSPGLRAAIEKAKGVNLPNDKIEGAIKKGAGDEARSMEQITYEAYGPGGTALVIEALTENRNRAAQEIKHILSKNGFGLAAPGSVTWAFEKEADNWIPKNKIMVEKEDIVKLQDLIEELEENGEVQEVFTNAS